MSARKKDATHTHTHSHPCMGSKGAQSFVFFDMRWCLSSVVMLAFTCMGTSRTYVFTRRAPRIRSRVSSMMAFSMAKVPCADIALACRCLFTIRAAGTSHQPIIITYDVELFSRPRRKMPRFKVRIVIYLMARVHSAFNAHTLAAYMLSPVWKLAHILWVADFNLVFDIKISSELAPNVNCARA